MQGENQLLGGLKCGILPDPLPHFPFVNFSAIAHSFSIPAYSYPVQIGFVSSTGTVPYLWDALRGIALPSAFL
jgi:hypothetical protein